MKLVVASGNKGKIREIQSILSGFEVVAYSDLIEPFVIEENGTTYKENALIKARAVYERLRGLDLIVLSDDSGVSVEALDNRPNIFSARYAGVGATDLANNNKLIGELQAKGLDRSPAFYTAAIAVVGRDLELTTHGWIYGEVITTPKGDGGFGYDPLFIPDGFTQTVAQLDEATKGRISHRAMALAFMKQLLGVHYE